MLQMAERWTPDTWRNKPIQQVPDYADRAALANVEKQLASFPPLSLRRALAEGRYGNPGSVHKWLVGFVKASPQSRRYTELAYRISEALGFMQAIGLDLEDPPELRTTDIYTSHEALLLGYEQAMTRIDSTSGEWYSTSGHFLWIGDRTRQLDHAHV